MINETRIPPGYRDLVERLGSPLGVEQARDDWSRIVQAAEISQRTTLITSGRAVWAALVPLDEVTQPHKELPVWSLTEARAQLGNIMIGATDLHGGKPQLLTRHRHPVAAIIDAAVLIDRPNPADRLPVDELLQDGHTLTLRYDHGQHGETDETGDVITEPYPPAYIATVHGHDGTEVGTGAGETIGEALICVTPHRPPAGGYDDEPPF